MTKTVLLLLLISPSLASSAVAADFGQDLAKFNAIEAEYQKKLDALEADRMAKEEQVVKGMKVEPVDGANPREGATQEELAKSVEAQRWNRFVVDWTNAQQNQAPDRTRVMLLRSRHDLEKRYAGVTAKAPPEATAKRP